MSRRNTLPPDVDPLSVIVPQPVPHHATTATPHQASSPKKVRVAFYLSAGLAEEIRNCVVHLSGPPQRLTMTALAEEAFREKLSCLQTACTHGEPFPPREGELKGGRPIQ